MTENTEEIQAGDLGQVVARPIVDEMQEAYLDYAMSVIVSRALPDVRDGLKPVHRRILYAMWTLGLKAGARFRKSATIVGEVLGKYHPHGDSSVYDSMVRMAQDFSMRDVLVWGQGNFGSMDGDSAAAYRYTEAKLSKIAELLLTDIEKATVDFRPNFDGSNEEPVVLPSQFPQLLVNGTMGIAVGMATSIPPHNLAEVCEAAAYLADNPGAEVADLMKFVPAPDFPTGGIVFDRSELEQAYSTGRGTVVMRAKTDIQEVKGMHKIIVDEIPYQVNKAELIRKIAELVKDKKIEGIKDLRDESNKEGVRIVIELKKDAFPKKILNQLFQLTPLQTSFHFNMLAIVDGLQPRVLNLKGILEEFIKHRKEVVARRTQYDLTKAQERAHILEGLHIALLHIDEIVELIKKSKDKDEARAGLIKKFKLSEIQAVAILEMRLQQLANLERLRVEQELEEKKKLIAELTEILKSEKKILAIVKQETLAVKDAFGTPRKTHIIDTGVKEFKAEDLIPNEPGILMITRDGYAKRVPPETFRAQHRGGKGVAGLTTKEEDVVEHMVATNTHSDVLFFTSKGRVFTLKAYEIPKTSRTAKGSALVNFLQFAPGEKTTAIMCLDELSQFKYFVMVTTQGVIKKTEIDDFKNIRASGLIAIKLADGDELKWVRPSTGKDQVMLVTACGQSIRFKEDGVRHMGRAAAGVRGIKLSKKDDAVVGMDVVEHALTSKDVLELFTMTGQGYGKRSPIKEYKPQGRGGSGIKTANVTAKNGMVIAASVESTAEEKDVMVISAHGQVIRFPFASVPSLGRATQGVRLMRFKEEGDSVVSVTFLDPDKGEE